MENQHRKITGYRELTTEDIALMNAIKEKGAELLALQAQVMNRLSENKIAIYNAIDNPGTPEEHVFGKEELARFEAAEPQRWANIGKTDIQTGIMALVRAVAQPAATLERAGNHD